MAIKHNRLKLTIDDMEVKTRTFICALAILILSSTTFANRLKDSNYPITHCYHWVDEDNSRYLTYKYQFARNNQGELTNYSTSRTTFGAKAGPGLYCAKTPIGSWKYGNRLIRIDFVEDVVFGRVDRPEKTCSIEASLREKTVACQNREVDVLFYHLRDEFYLIKNLEVIKKWSAYSPQVFEDINTAISEAGSDQMTVQHLKTSLIHMKNDSYKFPEVEFINEKRRFSGAQNDAD
ncbi:MAG: hypothetical protein JNM39_10415 [Bdellovibrionaceae bacterium]|nr:hypothetical protein [Pseudobdellovibrionaceae bacterium]